MTPRRARATSRTDLVSPCVTPHEWCQCCRLPHAVLVQSKIAPTVAVRTVVVPTVVVPTVVVPTVVVQTVAVQKVASPLPHDTRPDPGFVEIAETSGV